MLADYKTRGIQLRSSESLLLMSNREAHQNYEQLQEVLGEQKNTPYEKVKDQLDSFFKATEETKRLLHQKIYREVRQLTDTIKNITETRAIVVLSYKDDIVKRLELLRAYILDELQLERKEERRLWKDKNVRERKYARILFKEGKIKHEERKDIHQIRSLDDAEEQANTELAAEVEDNIKRLTENKERIEELDHMAKSIITYLDIKREELETLEQIRIDNELRQSRVLRWTRKNLRKEAKQQFKEDHRTLSKDNRKHIKQLIKAEKKILKNLQMSQKSQRRAAKALVAIMLATTSIAGNQQNPQFQQSIVEEHDIDTYVKSFYELKFQTMMEKDKEKIRAICQQTNIPKEVFLACIFVEDIRMSSMSGEKVFGSVANFKTAVRKHLPNKALEILGHNPNPEEGESAYGMAHSATGKNARTYLLSLDSLDQGTKAVINYEKPILNSQLELLTYSIKGILEYWKRAGFDLLSHNFSTTRTFGDRVALSKLSTHYTCMLPQEYKSREKAKSDLLDSIISPKM